MTMLFAALGRFDERALHALLTRRTRWLDRLMCGVTHFGDAPVIAGITAVLLLAAPEAMRGVEDIAAFALCVSHVLVQLVKRTVTRQRPRLPVGICSLIQAPDRFSFPSGHAAASLSVAASLVLAVSAPVAATLLAVALLVGVSRCYLGVHYPGDVLAGWALAVLSIAVGIALQT